MFDFRNFIDLRKAGNYRVLSNRVLCFVGESGLSRDFRVLSQNEADEYQKELQKKLDCSGMSGYCQGYKQAECIDVLEFCHYGSFTSGVEHFAAEKGIQDENVQVLFGYDYMIVTDSKKPPLYKIHHHY